MGSSSWIDCTAKETADRLKPDVIWSNVACKIFVASMTAVLMLGCREDGRTAPNGGHAPLRAARVPWLANPTKYTLAVARN